MNRAMRSSTARAPSVAAASECVVRALFSERLPVLCSLLGPCLTPPAQLVLEYHDGELAHHLKGHTTLFFAQSWQLVSGLMTGGAGSGLHWVG